MELITNIKSIHYEMLKYTEEIVYEKLLEVLKN